MIIGACLNPTSAEKSKKNATGGGTFEITPSDDAKSNGFDFSTYKGSVVAGEQVVISVSFDEDEFKKENSGASGRVKSVAHCLLKGGISTSSAEDLMVDVILKGYIS